MNVKFKHHYGEWDGLLIDERCSEFESCICFPKKEITMKKLLPGLNEDVSNADYHADRQYLSSSALKLLVTGKEEEFRDKYVLGRWTEEENYAFAYGTYVHTAILEPHLLDSTTLVYPEKTRAGNKFKSFLAANRDKTIITATEYANIQKILANYERSEVAKSIISSGRSEQTFCGAINGVPLKVRFDSVGNGVGLDVKTSSFPATLESFKEVIERFDYALSAALYMEVANLSGANVETFYFLFTNKKTYEITLVRASKALINEGRKQVYAAIDRYKELKQAGYFDIVPEDYLTIEESVTSEEG